MLRYGQPLLGLKKNTSVVDMFWAMGPFITGWLLFAMHNSNFTQLIITVMVSIWALRLTGYLYYTRIKKGVVDKRYKKIEEKWSGNYFINILKHFYFQAIFQACLMSVFVATYSSSLNTFSNNSIIIIILFILSIIGQSISDYQLYSYKKLNDGVCQIGLWKFSRHPNYFFEFTIWVTISLIANSHLISWLAPIGSYIIMRYITGPYTERLSLLKRGDEFRNYQKNVPMIFPSVRLIIESFYK